MSQTLDQKARDAARWAFEHEAENSDVTQLDCLDAALLAYLDALPPPEGDAGELVERLRNVARFHQVLPINARSEETALLLEAANMIERLSRQLPAPTGEAEPVAWQLWTGEEGGGFHIETVRWHAEEFARDGGKITPLYAAPVVAPAKAGWVLVPVVSTDEMHQAYTKAKYEGPKPTLIPDLWAAMLAAAPQSPMGEGTVGVWQPIETAPDGETRVLLAAFHEPEGLYWVTSGFLEGDGFVWCDWEDDSVRAENFNRPTHWQPLPAPPALSPSRQGTGK